MAVRVILNRAEAEFAARITAEGKTWFHQPKKFDLPEPHDCYIPDFYVVEDGKFYEIIGSRQAFSYSRKRIDAFRAQYPELLLEVVNSGAWVRGPGQPRQERVKGDRTTNRRPRRKLETMDLTRLRPEAAEIIRLAREQGIRSFSDLGRRAGVAPPAARLALLHSKNGGYSLGLLKRFVLEKA